MTIPNPTRCDVCNAESIVFNEIHGLNWWIVECASCGAKYDVEKRTGTISYNQEAQKAIKRINAIRKRGPNV